MTLSSPIPRAHRALARDLGIAPGILPPGSLNAITDVAGVLVGHLTAIEGDSIRTGATAIRPHRGNLYRDRDPAGIVVGNGYGKLIGSMQVQELGEIETPIVLTNTLAMPRAAGAILDWTLADAANAELQALLRSITPAGCTPGMLQEKATREVGAATTSLVAGMG